MTQIMEHSASSDRQGAYPWLEYAIVLSAGLAGYFMKKPFGLLLHHIMGISDVHANSISALTSNQAVQIAVVAILASIVHRNVGIPAAPLLERYLYGMHKDRKIRVLIPGLLGIVGCTVVVGGVRFIGAHYGVQAPLAAKLNMSSLSHATALKLAMLFPQTAVGAGLSEEVLYRFGIFTILTWLIWKITPDRPRPKMIGMGVAFVLQAMLFGFAHVSEGIMQLPAGSVLTQVLIAPETWAGMVFGYVYLKYGLEAAVISHAGADLINLSFFAAIALKHAH